VTRQYTEYANSNDTVSSLLDTLTNTSTSISLYRETMIKIGSLLGRIIATKYGNKDHELCLAFTVEDADYLAKGILDSLKQSQQFSDIRVACFWNERIKFEGISAAPIKRRYLEPSNNPKQTLVVIKSIISGACVVKTNLRYLINEREPENILIASPVILKGAEERLAKEFEQKISDRFKYIFFAIDGEKDDNDNVVPGIGGEVYQRLGFKDQEEKNRYSPEIVKTRRKIFSAA
jgi:uracil phosphoribosyltransferase